MHFITVLLLVILESSPALLFGPVDFQPKWDGLKVTWGPDLTDSSSFVSMPRTTKDAEGDRFKKVSDCDVAGKWRGSRYVQDDDTFLTLLYDVNGLIAGIQATILSDDASTYPGKGIQPPFIKDGDDFVLTAYFVDPATICSTGRSMEEFLFNGTGVNLYVQNGPDADKDAMLIPFKEQDMAGTKWSKGRCVPTMGVHYWYDPREGMDCDDFFPVFPLYNGGVLTGLGWAIGADVTSKHLDHKFISPSAPKPSMDQVTKCLTSFKPLSSMHIYLTSDIAKNTC